jgi:Cu(I)/Ag(I) efflux system membrane fusion protein
MNETAAEGNAGAGRGFLSRPVLVTAAAGLVLALAALAVGYGLGGRRGEGTVTRAARDGQMKVRFWTCSMHPQIKQPEKGLCPVCAMDLIPVSEGGGDEAGGPRRMVMSEAAQALAEIRTAPVERKFVEARVRMVGKVDYDETRVQHITAWFPGRLDRMYVDYTGIPVKKGDHLVYIYSPQLLAAQEELIQAKRAYGDALKGSSKFMKESSKATLEAAREKLRLWGLSAEQIAGVEKAGKARDHMTVYSPQSGIVITKHLNQGAYVKTGSRIYTIADLTRVWVRLDAYEADREWIRYGQNVEFTTEAYPGRVFRGKVTFIDPILDARTRTIKLRVIADNSDGRLQPGMFVRATVRPRVAAGGKVMDPSLAGKWISPMHPEVVKDRPGKCDVCGMPLVKAEEMGYVSPKSEAPLVIPASAPLITGTRAVVYVRAPKAKRPTFEGREIVLGPRAGDYYVVRAGLQAGERVVVNGSFKIDSALQIEARPSMMNPGQPPQTPQSSRTRRTGPTRPKDTGRRPQTHCPVMGGKIDRKVFTDYRGKRIYFCCPGCDATFKKDPEKYLEKLREAGVKLEDAPGAKSSGGHRGQ